MISSQSPNPVSFTILIPVRDEEGHIEDCVRGLVEEFEGRGVSDYEILVVDDGSSDSTGRILERLSDVIGQLRHVHLGRRGGFGLAVREGLKHYRGEAVAIVMGDGSESPGDVLLYYQKIREGAMCVFGSRFLPGGSLTGYPPLKFYMNRAGNWFLRKLFGIPHGDITNGFKAYRREVIDFLLPFTSSGFELSVELPLKALTQGFSYTEVPISWKKRRSGRSKFCLWKTPLRYLARILGLFSEKSL